MPIDLSNLSLEQLQALSLSLSGLDEQPVSIRQFLDDDYYLGRYFSSGFRDYWYGPLEHIFAEPGKSKYFLVFLAGSIGRGKSIKSDTCLNFLNHSPLTIQELYHTYTPNNPLYINSYNLTTHSIEPDKIIQVLDNGISPVYEIQLSHGEPIQCTDEHRFLDVDNQWATIANKRLYVGCYLKSHVKGQNSVKVLSITPLGQFPVYDITTEKNHNFTLSSVISHNSTTAVAACLYNLYSLLCYKNPQAEFNLVANDQILFAFMNTTQNLADRALMGKFNGMIASSPYFQKTLDDYLKGKRKREKGLSLFPKNIGLVSGSRITHTLGLNIFCLEDNTRIPLLDGRTLTIKDIALEFESGKDLYTYSLDIENKERVPGKISNVFDNGTQPMYRVTLDNGEYIDCTMNHKFLKRDNTYARLEELSVGDALMPFVLSEDKKGYTQWESPYTKTIDGVHRIVNRFNSGKIPLTCVTHHINFNKKDNTPDNLITMDRKEHFRYHSQLSKEMWEVLKNNKEWYDNYLEFCSKRSSDFWQKKKETDPEWFANYKDKFTKAGNEKRSNPETNGDFRKKISLARKSWWNNLTESEKQQEIERLTNILNKSKQTPEEVSKHFKNWWSSLDPDERQDFIKKRGESLSNSWKNLSPEEREQRCKKMSEAQKKSFQNPEIWNKATNRIKEASKRFLYDSEYEESRKRHREKTKEYNNRPEVKERTGKLLGKASKAAWANATDEEKKERIRKNVTARILSREYKRYVAGQEIRYLENYKNYFSSYEELIEKVKNYNHQIVSIECIGERHAYNLEIEKFHNFALDCGIYSSNSAILSEVAFNVVNNQMLNLFDSIMARQQSRFLKDGKSAGIIWVDSSEGDKSSELAILKEKYKNKPGVYVDSGPLWQVKPEDYTDGRFFYLFTGNEQYQPKILDPDNDTTDKKLLSSGQILVVPEVHRVAFEADIARSMRDLAGIPTSSSSLLFRNTNKLLACLTYQPLFEDIIVLDFDDKFDQISNHCQHPDYFQELPFGGHPRFIHMDLAYSNDKLGIACGYILGTKEVKSIVFDSSEAGASLMPIYCTDFAFSIQAKAGQQIPIYKVRIFIDWLKNNGVSIGGISTDTFQSFDLLQSMKLMGFETQLISMDRTADNYYAFRNAIYEERVILPRNKLLTTELLHLEVSSDLKKVDHPASFPDGNIGSKDCADACCGSYTLAVMKNADTMFLHTPSIITQPKVITDSGLVGEAIEGMWGKKPTPDYYEKMLKEQEEMYSNIQKNPLDFWNKKR